MPKNSPFGVQTERLIKTLNVQTSQKNKEKTEAPYMFCPCLFIILTTHRIPNVSPGSIFGELIFGRIFGLVYRGPIFGGAYLRGACIRDFTVYA